jgi:hypothetical protein
MKIKKGKRKEEKGEREKATNEYTMPISDASHCHQMLLACADCV